MKILTRPSASDAAALAAEMLASTVRSAPDAVLGLATGRTMERVYAELGRLHRIGLADLSRGRSFNLDEYVGLQAEDARSFRQFMQRHFVSAVNIDARQVQVPDGGAPDPEAEARDYDRRIAAAGGIDLQLLGVGENGHIGFNEPGTSFDARTHVTSLTPETRRQNAAMFGGEDAVPRQAITMGTGTILEAKRVLLLATGPAKAEAIRQALQGPVTEAVPCSALQMHRDCVVILDEAAALKLG